MNYSLDNNFTTLIRYVPSHELIPKRDSLWVIIPITICFIIIFVCGVLGNLCTCYVIFRNKHMHTCTNYYLFSLAVSDLLLLMSGPIPELYTMWYRYPYPFGEITCITTLGILEISTNATILTITAFTVERYIAICHPFFSHIKSKLSRAIKYIVGIWLLALFLALPQVTQVGLAYVRDKYGNIIDDELKLCGIKDQIMPMSFLTSSLLLFVAPLTLIIVLYVLIIARLRRSAQFLRDESHAQCNRTIRVETSTNVTHCVVRGNQGIRMQRKSPKKVVNMLIAVVMAFFFCWAPFHVQRLFSSFGFQGAKTSDTAFIVNIVLTYASGVLFYLSAAINPVLYNIMSSKFREAFKSTLIKCCERDRPRQEDIFRENLAGRERTRGNLHHSTLSRRSSRTNNSNSSVNSRELGSDLTKRPLVVSFKRRGVRTLSGDRVPLNCRRSHFSQDHCSGKNTSPDQEDNFMFDERVMIHQSDTESNCLVLPLKRKQNKDSSSDDIETFQERHLKIKETNELDLKQYKCARSCSLYINKNKTLMNTDSLSLRYVRKSSTVPCLTLH